MSVYYFNVKGGLTACDLINSLAQDPKVVKVIDSRLFKEDLVAKVQNEEYACDSFVREKLVEALSNLKPKLNAEFYGLEDAQPTAEKPTGAPEAEQPQQEDSAWINY